MSVTRQSFRRRSKAAKRRKGTRWPIPALGNRATWAVLGLWISSERVDMVGIRIGTSKDEEESTDHQSPQSHRASKIDPFIEEIVIIDAHILRILRFDCEGAPFSSLMENSGGGALIRSNRGKGLGNNNISSKNLSPMAEIEPLHKTGDHQNHELEQLEALKTAKTKFSKIMASLSNGNFRIGERAILNVVGYPSICSVRIMHTIPINVY
ncbi:hypothetical protein F8388_014933 [Cannabis sativa]|uniref:Uncharacterized protein n=1 Tax=Cannabis sativa TaxID=3483 RepID=A0A7J6F6C4_CANSA|nr:hypothetical protein F8388_014933 [Cannabis sativa]